ncbi:MAG: UDP-N-acetylmuramoyl-L-alanine--D-glutamate ligase [Desulfovibrionaceae bacterium]|nr:UDP-N-acetylmuramoyl-L-alanine--D-glutamate ligase [Desulfovibrionaceae bacterium]
MRSDGERGARLARGSRVVVVGYGRSGRAALALLVREGCTVRLLERNPKAMTEEEIQVLRAQGVAVYTGEHTKRHFAGADAVVISPGIPRASLVPFVEEGCPILAEMELAWRYLNDEPILAVTGTSGKTTTVSLAAAMLQAQGLRVFLGGNIGTPLSEYVLDKRQADVLVLEVSSFQLQCCDTLAPRVAVLLNISPNHLDYHKDMKEYCDAKFRLFRWQDANDLAVLGKGLEAVACAYNLKGRTVWVSESNRFPESRLIGRHNRFNAEAAWQACRFFGVSESNARKAVARFAPLPNRLECVREHRGVLYVNDSKCTTLAALRVALEAFDRPVRLLCGGKFKGGDVSLLLPVIEKHVVQVALFGASREVFEPVFSRVVPVSWYPTLAPAVEALFAEAKPRDVILLSPATSSFDLYANYVERGRDFRSLVEALP